MIVQQGLGQVRVDAACFWTFETVRDALVECAQLWRRSPGAGQWPLAADGPWHLMQRDVNAGDYDARGGDGTSSDVALRPLPLTREEVSRRDAVSEWLLIVPAAADRQLLAAALDYLASGRTNVPWRKVRRRLGIAYGEYGLRKRWERAINVICQALNGAEIRR